MTPIEIIALIFIAFAVIKLSVIWFSPKAWMKIPKAMFSRPIALSVVSLALAGVVLYYLLQELTIVQVFASALFILLVIMASMTVFGKEIVPFAEKLMAGKSILKRMWFPLIVWDILIFWVLYAIFF